MKKFESSKVDKASGTRCSISYFFFSFRYGISFRTISGEVKSVTEEMMTSWLKTTLPTILSRYPLQDIFNADKFGLFYQCVPNKAYNFKDQKCTGGKHSNISLTRMAG